MGVGAIFKGIYAVDARFERAFGERAGHILNGSGPLGRGERIDEHALEPGVFEHQIIERQFGRLLPLAAIAGDQAVRTLQINICFISYMPSNRTIKS